MTTVTLTFGTILGTQTSYTEDGITIMAAGGPPWGNTVVGPLNNLGGVLFDFENQADTFTAPVGEVFDATSIQLNGRTIAASYDYTFTGLKADGTTVTQTFVLDQNPNTSQLFHFDSSFSNLVSLTTDGPLFAAITNVVLNIHGTPPNCRRGPDRRKRRRDGHHRCCTQCSRQRHGPDHRRRAASLSSRWPSP